MTVYKMWLEPKDRSRGPYVAMATDKEGPDFVTSLYGYDPKFETQPFSAKAAGSPVAKVKIGQKLPTRPDGNLDLEETVKLIFRFVAPLLAVNPHYIYELAKSHGGTLALGDADIKVPDDRANAFETALKRLYGAKVKLTRM